MEKCYQMIDADLLMVEKLWLDQVESLDTFVQQMIWEVDDIGRTSNVELIKRLKVSPLFSVFPIFQIFLPLTSSLSTRSFSLDSVF